MIYRKIVTILILSLFMFTSLNAKEEIPSGKTIDWYLEEADRFFNEGNYNMAKEYYQKVLQMDSQDPLARKRFDECEHRLNMGETEKKYIEYVARGERYNQKGEVAIALDYYLQALKVLPDKTKDIALKMKQISDSHPTEWENFSIQNKSDLKFILERYFLPDAVLRIRDKVKNIYKNAQGMWEVDIQDGFIMVYMPSGSFMMGSNSGWHDEKPEHQVELDCFWMGKYEVTRAQWRLVMGGKYPDLADHPVRYVSWHDVQKFISRLNAHTGQHFRLPTEAEWEYACRADSKGDIYGDLNEISWNKGNSNNSAHPVGQKQPNAWGLYDMLENTGEWCQDWHSDNYYSSSPTKNPQGPSSGEYRVTRGGDWWDDFKELRFYRRKGLNPSARVSNGFRLAMD